MLKLQYPICCGVDIHKKLIVATIVTTDSKESQSMNKKRSLPSTLISKSSTTGELKIVAITSAWNPLASIGFLFLITSNQTSKSVSLIQSMSRPSKEICPDCKSRCLFKAFNGSMCPCCYQKQKGTLFCSQIWTH